MKYPHAYVEEFREFARRVLSRRPEYSGEPITILIDDEHMRATIRGAESMELLADPPFFGYVDRYVDGTLCGREMCETAQKYAEQVAGACKWAEDSPADRSVKADRLTYVGHYAPGADRRRY